MKRSQFASEEAFQAQLEKGKKFFHDVYHIGRAYDNPQVAVPMAIHIFERMEQTNNLLERIVNLLESSANESSE